MYLAIAQKSLSNGGIPTEDPFLFSFKNWHVYHEWLSYFIWYLFYSVASFTGVILFKAFLWVSAFLVIIWKKGLEKSSQAIALCILFLAAVGSSHRFVEKASIFSDMFFVFLLVMLLQPTKDWKKIRWLLPVLFLFWVNLHPAFILGLALLGLYLLTQRSWPSKDQIQSLIFSLAACFINPEFWKGVIFPLQTALKLDWEIYHKINFEWISTFNPMFTATFEVKALIYLAIVTLFLVMLQFRNIKFLFSISVYLLLLYLLWKASRFMSTASLGFAALCLYNMDELSLFKNKNIARAASYAMGFLFIILNIWILNKGYDSASGHREISFAVHSVEMPVAAADFVLENKLSGRFFNEFGWGSYLAWRFSGNPEIFIHGHIDDPKLLLHDYFGVGKSKEFFDASVKKYGIKYFFLNVKNLITSPPPLLLRFFDPMKIVYQDEQAIILELP